MPNSTININNIESLNWKEFPEKNLVMFDDITIWRAEVNSFINDIDELKLLLQPTELEKATRYQQERDHQRYIISKSILRVLLSRYLYIKPQEVVFYTIENKKPFLQTSFSSDVHFNVSHSGKWILIAISSCPVGIDVEEIQPSFDYQSMLPFCYSAAEINVITQSSQPHQSFYQFWTRKESLLKATGKGLVDELLRIPALDGNYANPSEIIGSDKSWQISSFKVDENHVASVSFDPLKTVSNFFNFQL